MAVQAWILAQAARREAPDVIHLHGLDFPVHARILSASPAPVLVQDHAGLANRPRFAPLRRWGYARISCAVFAAEAQADPFLATGQLPPGLPVFTAPVNSADFKPGSQAEARRRCGVSGDPAVLWIGHLIARKDPLTFLRAAALALDRLPGLELWMAYGDAVLLDEIETFLAAHPALKARTHLLGRVDHSLIEDLSRACDMFVSPSRSEGYGYALIEAMACGLPPVASDIPSFREILGQNGAGVIAPAGNHQAVAEQILRLAAEPKDALRQQVRARFDAALSFDIVGARLAGAYAAVTHGAGR
jgi:glycosyltransferase involved in cell wall biosynthesis